MARDLCLKPDNIKSAGFVNKQFECFGESISLNVKSRGEVDTSLIRNHFQIGK